MRVASPVPKKHARIEIIPLIDIMFFLLASFMMVSLSQTHMKGIKVNLPSQGIPPPNTVKDFVSIRVAAGPVYYFDGKFVDADQVMPQLFALHQQNPAIKVSISAEPMALHGDVIGLLDKVRQAQIDKVGYQIRTGGAGGAPPPH
jgi:biopolymer transport protein ExbD